MRDSLNAMYQQETDFAEQQGLTREVMGFIHQSLQHFAYNTQMQSEPILLAILRCNLDSQINWILLKSVVRPSCKKALIEVKVLDLVV